MKKKFHNRFYYVFLFVLLLICTGCGSKKASVNTDDSIPVEEQSQAANSPAESTEESEAAFPILLEEGKLAIKSIFQSSIPNPDNGFEEAVDMASIELVNQSDAYLEQAEIAITLEDGTALTFEVFDIPAGKTVWAFDLNNTTIAAEHPYREASSKAEFDEDYDGWEGQFQVESESAIVKLKNLTGKKQKDMKVKVHCAMDGSYFGGTSYEYNVEQIASEETVTLEIIESYFGEAEVVRIEYQ